MPTEIGSLPIFSSKARVWSVSSPDKECASFLCHFVDDKPHTIAIDCSHFGECALESNRCPDFKFARQVSQSRRVSRRWFGDDSKVESKNYFKSIGRGYWTRNEIGGLPFNSKARSIYCCHGRWFVIAQRYDSNLGRCHFRSGIPRPWSSQAACNILSWPENSFWHFYSRRHLKLLCLAQEHSRFVCGKCVDLQKDVRCV